VRYLLCIFAGLVAGFSLAAAFNALGVPARIALYWGSKKALPALPVAAASGAALVAWVTMSGAVLSLGVFACAALLLIMGIFLGYSAMSLAETLDLYPLESAQPGSFFAKAAVLGIALGKLAGNLWYFFWWEGWQ